jgi:hypothetical protein
MNEEDNNLTFLEEMTSFCDTTTRDKGKSPTRKSDSAELAYFRDKARLSDKRVRIGLRSTTPPPRNRISGDSPCSER